MRTTILMAFIFGSNFIFSQEKEIETDMSEMTTSPALILAEKLVSLYQSKAGVNSINRCPFSVSCSNYLVQSINDKGFLLGLALFIDRYFYRENRFVGKHYRIVLSEKLLYDDSISEKYRNYLYYR